MEIESESGISDVDTVDYYSCFPSLPYVLSPRCRSCLFVVHRGRHEVLLGSMALLGKRLSPSASDFRVAEKVKKTAALVRLVADSLASL